MGSDAPVLEFDQVTIVSDGHYDTSITDVSFTLSPGDLLLIRLESEALHLPLPDAASGVIKPTHGDVRFHGHSWREMAATQAAARRGRIGRVFEGVRWLSNWELSENIMLAQMHHTCRPESEVREQAEDLARAFGLPGLPMGRPTQIRRQDLIRAACARAFMGSPDLMILERPTLGVFAEIHSPLLNMLRSVRERGGAIVWLTEDSDIWELPSVHPTMRIRMHGSYLCPVHGRQ